ncbi:uncharacterized protein LOC124446197 [Xenia sp. Carnegie-2017]|uniref:uncharacterized protein LOC124446197 n=1 Tax=Xenia sp. Carnegie-2017 TaxID=2897299 RepID=UPI001F047C1E|nr:uncharacterized protein LOC124446197 [Xenia sp. Carnegie-2017]
MVKEGGGFTFNPREAVIKGKLPQLINQVFKNKTQVLLRIQKNNGLQPFTHSKHNLAVLMHEHRGYTQPRNHNLDDYLFLGVLPNIIAKQKPQDHSKKGVQGFRNGNQFASWKQFDLLITGHRCRLA